MPATKIGSRWSGGDLIFYESQVSRATLGDVLRIGDDAVEVGSTTNDIDFKWYGTGGLSFILDVGDSSMTLAGCNVSIDGDVEIGSDDIALDQGYYIYFEGLASTTNIRADAVGYMALTALTGIDFVIGSTDEMAITATAVTLASNNLVLSAGNITVAVGSYLYLDASTGNYLRCSTDDNVILNGGTTVKLGIAGTAEVSVTGAALYPETDNGQTLGILNTNEWSDLFLADGGVIGWNNNDVTITHSTDALTLASTWTAAAVGRPFGVNLTLNVKGGNYVNALKGYVECGTGGGTIGLLSAVNCEIKMPNAACAGAFYPLEVEWVGQASTAFGRPGTGSASGFIYMAASGTVTDFDADGMLMTINGLSTGAGSLFSTGTLRLSISDTLYYLPLSTVAATFTFGYPVALTSTLQVGVNATGHDVTFYGDTTGESWAYDADLGILAQATTIGDAALVAHTITVTDSGTVSSGRGIGMFVDYVLTGTKTGTYGARPLRVNTNIGADCDSVQVADLYLHTVADRTIGTLFGITMYWEDYGNAIEQLAMIDLGMNSPHGVTGDRHTFFRCREHTIIQSNSDILRLEGLNAAHYLVNFTDAAGAADSGVILENHSDTETSDQRIMVKTTLGDRYIYLYPV